ncbi:MAG TPA: carboxypeptidase regulatory-like domain-containing protein [Bryobacteraceae bacterium]|nr:carboxypeptidase regulatory-like domain-containing protein [Bryobacteraceae bacterium]
MRQTLRSGSVLAVLAAGLVIGGCGRSGEDASKAPAPSSAPGLKADTENGATVTGKVAFAGDKPAMREIDMSANPACLKAHPTPTASEEVIVNGNATLANAFVWVKEGVPEGKWAAPATALVVDQQGCVYKPHVAGAVIGQTVEFRNSDETNHNIHPLPEQNPEWNESQPPKGSPKPKTFDRQEVMIPIKCNIHPWMRAYLGVVRHPFFAVTGTDGTFTIAGLPPGKYTLEVWHERYGRQQSEFTVAAKDKKTLDFTIGANSKPGL